MSRYQYEIKDNTVSVIGAEKEVIVYDIESWKPEIVSYYRSLLAQRQDMEYAKEYLNQMFFQQDTSLIDGALINSAIQLLVKCFANPQENGRRRLDVQKVLCKYSKKMGEVDLTKQFGQFYTARNKVISHDELDFKTNIVGLAVNKSSGMAEDIAGLTLRTGYLYAQNQKILLRMVNVVSSYINDQLSGLDMRLIEEYNKEKHKPHLSTIACANIPMGNAW